MEGDIMLKRCMVWFLAAAFLVGGLTAQAEELKKGAGSGKSAPTAAKGESAAALKLKEASLHRRRSFKQPADEKRRILLEAAALYEAVIIDYPECRPESAQAAFRAGEIYRSVGLPERAGKSFQKAVAFDRSGEFAARSLNELGHLHRRKKDYPKALEFYARVQKECPKVRDECADAVTWTGKVLLKQEQSDRGRQVLLGFAERFPDFPVQAIRNIDLAACSLIKEGRIDAAAVLVESCRQTYDRAGDGNKSMKRKIEKALGKMKADEILAELARENAGNSKGN